MPCKATQSHYQDSTALQGMLLLKHTICSNSSQYVYDKIVKASVSGVFDLSNILQFVIDSFYYGSFS